MWEIAACWRPFRPTPIAGLTALVLAALAGVAWAANEGTITSLSATDAPAFNQAITINATFQADANINNSNVSYEIIAPDGVTVVATHLTSMPVMETRDTFADSWTTMNSSFPGSGTYTLRACWNNGSSTNCQIAAASTSFFSVPTTGLWLALVGAVGLGWFLWRNRGHFRKPAAGASAGVAGPPAKTVK